MLRSLATRSLLKASARAPLSRSSYTAASARFHNATTSSLQQLSSRRPQVLAAVSRPTTSSLLYATKPLDHPLEADEIKKAGREKLEVDPEAVSTDSSVRKVFERSPAPQDRDEAMMAGVRSDIKTIKETFSLHEVPKESLYLGLAGVLPYAATSLSTVYLAYDINQAHATGTGLLFSPETAHQLLDLIIPIQIGYGAVIISFLSAIHWGMEYSSYGGRQSYRRYMIGVIGPAVAWPTILMPIEYALITQFLAFNFIYFVDARATARGWFPAWYSTYRFVLTFLVGASIVVSLVGRGQIVHDDARMKSPVDYVKEDRDQQWEALEREEKERRAKMAAADEEGDDEDEGKDDEDEESEEESGDDKEDKK